MAQLYYSTEQHPEFSESHTERFQITGSGDNWQVIRLFFEADSELQQLRFDPENRTGLQLDVSWITLSRQEK